VKAVNLIPADTRKGAADFRALRGPGFAVVAVLGTALVLVTLYVLASNSVTSRQAKLASVRQQLAQTRTLAANLSGYTKFANLAQARVETVREIATSRFDWQRVLTDLSKVVPANTTLSSLSATVSPSAGTGSSASGGGLRGDIPAPAFELQGCTASQDDVARLMSRLRLITGVTRVTLASAAKSSSTGSAVASGSPGGCKTSASNFDVVVFFTPPAGSTTASTTPAGSTTAAAPSSSTAPAAGATSTSTTSSTTTTTTPSGATQ
jgi:Tfp pilus assembly protein PilN